MKTLWLFPRIFAAIGVLLLLIASYVYTKEPIPGSTSPHAGSMIATFLALVFGGIGFTWLYIVRRRQAMIEDLKLTGAKVKARVLGVEQRTNITVNNRHPWRIQAEAEEPSRAGQVFYSDNLWSDPRARMPETVDVWVDRNDPTKHYVDIEFLRDSESRM